MSATSIDRRDDIVRLLSDAPEGLSDGDLARALGDGVRPQTVNALCRRMASAGVVERIGTRPIRTRLLTARPGPGLEDPPAPETATAPEPSPEDAVPEEVPPPEAGRDDAPPPVSVIAPEPGPRDAVPEEVPPPEAARDDAPPPETATAEPSPEDAVPGEAAPAEAGPDDAAADPPAEAPAAARTNGNGTVRPTRDVLQGWSRTVNVQAAVASWLRGRGATIRSATLDGTAPARDLVARLDGDDLHVETTGWPPDGDRTHPTTIAADWFSAATRAAVRRRGAQPDARIVIALPDTRRYRALATAQGADLAGARTEVWFVDPTGAVDQTVGERTAGRGRGRRPTTREEGSPTG